MKQDSSHVLAAMCRVPTGDADSGLPAGGTEPNVYAKNKEAGTLNELPNKRGPYFTPVIHPTLVTGVEMLVVAARAWLSA